MNIELITPVREIVSETAVQTRPKKLIAHDVVESTVAKTEGALYKGIKFNTEVVNIEILQEAEVLFTDVPGARELIDIVETYGQIECEPGHLGTAKGAMFELEAGVELQKQGKEVIAFNKNLKGSTSAAQFDIVTSDVLYECKNRRWDSMSTEGIDSFKRQVGRAAKTARDLDKSYCVVIKGRALPEIKNCLLKKNVNFMEL